MTDDLPVPWPESAILSARLQFAVTMAAFAVLDRCNDRRGMWTAYYRLKRLGKYFQLGESL